MATLKMYIPEGMHCSYRLISTQAALERLNIEVTGLHMPQHFVLVAAGEKTQLALVRVYTPSFHRTSAWLLRTADER